MATIFFGDYMIDGAKYDKFSKIRQLTRAEFDAIVDKDPDTLYVITDEENNGSETVGDMTKTIYDPNNIASDIFGYGYSKDEIDNLLSSGVKIQTGSYVGTGTHGSSNPCSLTFDFEPKVIFIYCMSGNRNPQDSDAIMFLEDFNETFTQGSNSYSMAIHLVATTAGSTGGLYGQAGYIYGKKNNNTVSWYSDTNSQLQINYKGKIYRYLAIG